MRSHILRTFFLSVYLLKEGLVALPTICCGTRVLRCNLNIIASFFFFVVAVDGGDGSA